MSHSTWRRWLNHLLSPARRRSPRADRKTFRPTCDMLEDRCLLSCSMHPSYGPDVKVAQPSSGLLATIDAPRADAGQDTAYTLGSLACTDGGASRTSLVTLPKTARSRLDVTAGGATLSTTGPVNFVGPEQEGPGTPNKSRLAALDVSGLQPGPELTGYEPATFSNVDVATFGDGDPNAPDGLSATIDWGDGTITHDAAIVSYGYDGYAVEGTHTYNEGGTYPITVTVTDAAGSTQTTGEASVEDAPLQVTNQMPVQAAEGKLYKGQLVTFKDTGTGTPAQEGDFTAKVDWGDGSTTLGTVVTDGSIFAVNGSHTYAEAGTFPVKVRIEDVHGSMCIGNLTADVSDVPFAVTGAIITSTAGSSFFNGAVGVVSDDNPLARPADFTVTIAWGDGHISSGSLDPDGNGKFEIRGSNTYAMPGSYRVHISVSDAGRVSAAGDGAAEVDDGLIHLPGPPVSIFTGRLHRLKRRGRRYRQTVTLVNMSDRTLAAPISLVLAGLGHRVRLLNASGFSMADDPFINAHGPLAPYGSADLVLEFLSPTPRIKYEPYVVVGPGPR
jgi:hypothetical protein